MIQRDLRGLQPKFLLETSPSAALDRVSHGFVQLKAPRTRSNQQHYGQPSSRGAVSALVSIQAGWEALLSEQELLWL